MFIIVLSSSSVDSLNILICFFEFLLLFLVFTATLILEQPFLLTSLVALCRVYLLLSCYFHLFVPLDLQCVCYGEHIDGYWAFIRDDALSSNWNMFTSHECNYWDKWIYIYNLLFILCVFLFSCFLLPLYLKSFVLNIYSISVPL